MMQLDPSQGLLPPQQRQLINATTPDRYPVPHTQDSSSLADIFSKVDLPRGYPQVPTPGRFEFMHQLLASEYLPKPSSGRLGLCSVLCDLLFLFPYLCDILIGSASHVQHRPLLQTLSARLDQLGLIVTGAAVRPLPSASHHSARFGGLGGCCSQLP